MASAGRCVTKRESVRMLLLVLYFVVELCSPTRSSGCDTRLRLRLNVQLDRGAVADAALC